MACERIDFLGVPLDILKEEDIEKVTWKSDKKLRKTLKKSFLNIKELFLSEKM